MGRRVSSPAPGSSVSMRHLSRFVVSLAMVCAGSLIGCGGDAGSGSPNGPSTPAPTAGAASFAQIQNAILTPSCATSGCHSGVSPQANLSLTSDVAYDRLVGVGPTNP